MAWEIASATENGLNVADIGLIWAMASKGAFPASARVWVCWEMRGDFYPAAGSYGEDELVIRTSEQSDDLLTVADLLGALKLQSQQTNPLYAEIVGQECLYAVRSVTASDGQLIFGVYAGDELRLDS